METKDLVIYQGIAAAAAKVFNFVEIPAGEYSAQEINTALFGKKRTVCATFAENFETSDLYGETGLINISYDGYSCTFPADSIFGLLNQLQTCWGIAAPYRAKFIRKADAAPVVVSFDVPSVLKQYVNAVAKEKTAAADSVKYVCIDTRRRAVVCCNGNVLAAAPVPDMYVSQDAKETYLIDPILVKSGKGRIIIRNNGNAENGGQTRPVADIVYPRWEKVLPAVSEDAAVHFGRMFPQIKKSVLAAAKFSNQETPKTVILRAVAGADNLEIIGFKADYYDENTATETRVNKISLPQPVPFTFTVAINGTDINTISAADRIYLESDGRGIIFADPLQKLFVLIMPVYLNHTPWNNETFKAPAGVVSDILGVCRFPLLNDENTAAAVSLFEDAQTGAAVPDNVPAAVLGSDNVATVTFDFWPENFARRFSLSAEEIENEKRMEKEYLGESDDDAPAVVSEDAQESESAAAVAVADPCPLNQETRAHLENYSKCFYQEIDVNDSYLYLLQHGVKILFGEIYLYDRLIGRIEKEITDYLCTGVSFVWLNQESESAAPVAAEDAPDTTNAAVADSVPADNVSVAEDAQESAETPAAVAEDAPAVAVPDSLPADSMPAAVAAQMKIQNAVFLGHNILSGLIMIHKYDSNLFAVILESTNKGYKTKEIEFYPNSRKRAKIITKYFYKLDIQPGGKSLFDVCPADKIESVLAVLQKYDKQTFDVAAPAPSPAPDVKRMPGETFMDYLKRVADSYDAPAVAEDAQESESAAAVPDSVPVAEDAQPAPVCLPVAVAVPAVWYAVYNSENSLHGVYYSRIVADDLVIRSLFMPGQTWNICAVADPSAAPVCLPSRAEIISQIKSETNAAVFDCLTYLELSILAAEDAQKRAAVPSWERVPADSVSTSEDAQESAAAVCIDTETARNIEIAATGYMYEYSCTDETFWAAVDYLRRNYIKIKRCKVYLSNYEIATINLIKDNAGKCISISVSYNVEIIPAVVPDSVSAPADSLSLPVADSVPADNVSVAEDAQETPAVADIVPPYVSPFAYMPEIWETGTAEDAQESAAAVAYQDAPDVETPAVADSVPSWERGPRRRFRLRRGRFAPWLIRAAAVAVLIVFAAVSLIDNARKTPAAAFEDAQPVPVVVVPDSLSGCPDVAAPADSVSVPADSLSLPVADNLPSPAKIHGKNARKRARRAVPDSLAAVAVADSCKQFAAVVPDSVPADSLSLPVADSLTFAAVPADSISVPSDSVAVLIADSLAADSLSGCPAVAVPDSVAVPLPADSVSVPSDSLSLPVADSLPADSVSTAEDAQETTNAAVADSVPADNVSTAEDAPDVPAVLIAYQDAQPVPVAVVHDSVPADSLSGCPAVAVRAYVTDGVINHRFHVSPVIGCVFNHCFPVL